MKRTLFLLVSTMTMLGALMYTSPAAAGGDAGRACEDAGLTGRALGQCQAYCNSGCTPDSPHKRCAKKRARYHEETGLVAFPCDCQAAAAEEAAFLAANPPPAPEPVVRAVLAVPAGVDPDSVSDATFHPDGEHLLWTASLIGESDDQIMISKIDGSDFSCLTCPLGGLPFAKIDVFADGRRLVVGNQVTFGLPAPFPYPSPFGPGFETVPILECTPSLLDCQTPELVFVRVPFDPADPLLFPNQRVREFRIAPDGVHLAWSQARNDFLLSVVGMIGELRREAGHYELDNVEALIRPEPVLKPLSNGEYEFAVPPSGEIKRFIEGGAAIAGASAKEFALNRDAGRLDIATGETQRLTHHPDYDEPIAVSPDGGWLVVGSKRSQDPAFDVLAAFGLVPRPNFVSLGGTQLFSLWAFNGNLGNNRGLDTWLVDRLGARGGYIGQHLSNDVCYGGRERQHWNADGTRVAKGEQIRPVMASNPLCQGLPTRRLVVYELVSRTPVPPEDRPPVVRTPAAPWAAGITDAKNRPGVDPGLYVVPGRVFGEAHVDVASAAVSVEYRDYSDDGLLVLNGVESFTREPRSISYPADIEVSGCRSGFLWSNASLNGFPELRSPLAPLSGSASSQLGDESFEICAPGLPGVDSCP
jgi:hypothetical protein